MKNSILPRVYVTALFTGLTATAGMAGVEETIELTNIPDEIMTLAVANLKGLPLAVAAAPENIDDNSEIDDNLVLAHTELGDVTLISANTETEEDQSFVYEIQGEFPDGRKVEIDIEPSGKVAEIEIEFKVSDVPGAVINAIDRQMPGFTPEFIEASHSPSMQVIGYEFVGAIGGEKLDIEVSPDGRNISISDQ